jgi:Spy/CpxP family protein refolding chaperone
MSNSRQRNVRLAAGAILAVTFAGGIAVGFALDRGVAQASPDRERGVVDAGPPPPPPNEWIIDRLDLDQEQRMQVDSVIAHYGSVMSDLQREYRPRFNEVVRAANEGVRGAMTPEQVMAYDSLEAAMQERRNRGGGGPRR